MRERSSLRSWLDNSRRGPAMALMAVTALASMASGCSGERPELVSAGQPASSTSAVAQTTIAEVAPQAADCVTAAGGRPWPVTIEAATPAVACVRLANHQRIEFINNTPDAENFELAGLAVNIEPGATFVTEPAGTFLQPGLTELNAVPHPVSGLWVAQPAENTLAGLAVGLKGIGAIEVGATPVEITAAIGGATVAAADAECYVTTIAGDPYSPLFTISGGTLAVIQVFTPGQLTRSEIGVGSSEGDVLAAYGQQIESHPSPDGDVNNKLLVFVPVDEADAVFRLVFALENDVVTSLRIGLADMAVANPECPA